jgi:hypothetical protein
MTWDSNEGITHRRETVGENVLRPPQPTCVHLWRITASCLLFVTALAITSCDAVRAPTFAFVKEKEGGCGNVFFHKGTKDGTEFLVVSADKTKLGLPEKGSKTFDLAKAPDGLTVVVDLWKTAPRFSPYCNDISASETREAIWKARKGKVTITFLGPSGKPIDGRGNYRASIKLENVTFEDDSGHQATLKEESITEVLVGWLAG